MQTSVYHKPTDSFNYLHYESCHPQHTRDNIAVSLAKRIIRITSEETTRDQHLNELRHHLIDRGHPTESINKAFMKVFSPKHDNKLETLVFTTTYNPKHVYQKHRITRCLNNLTNSEMMRTLKNNKIICSYRQPPSLGSKLIRSRFDLEPRTLPCNSDDIIGLSVCSKCIQQIWIFGRLQKYYLWKIQRVYLVLYEELFL